MSHTSARLHTKGGLLLGTFASASNLLDPSDSNDDVSFFTCAELFRPIGSLVTSQDVVLANQYTHMLIGSNTKNLYTLDLNIQNEPVVTYDVTCPTVTVHASSSHIVAGGSDGKIRILDGR